MINPSHFSQLYTEKNEIVTATNRLFVVKLLVDITDKDVMKNFVEPTDIACSLQTLFDTVTILFSSVR